MLRLDKCFLLMMDGTLVTNRVCERNRIDAADNPSADNSRMFNKNEILVKILCPELASLQPFHVEHLI